MHLVVQIICTVRVRRSGPDGRCPTRQRPGLDLRMAGPANRQAGPPGQVRTCGPSSLWSVSVTQLRQAFPRKRTPASPRRLGRAPPDRGGEIGTRESAAYAATVTPASSSRCSSTPRSATTPCSWPIDRMRGCARRRPARRRRSSWKLSGARSTHTFRSRRGRTTFPGTWPAATGRSPAGAPPRGWASRITRSSTTSAAGSGPRACSGGVTR